MANSWTYTRLTGNKGESGDGQAAAQADGDHGSAPGLRGAAQPGGQGRPGG